MFLGQRGYVSLLVVFTAVFLCLRFAPTEHSYTMKLGQLRSLNGGLQLTGKTAVVVGGTSGIGRGIAVRLAKADVAVTIVGRNAERAEAVLAEMNKLTPSDSVKHSFLPCDAQLLSTVFKCCKQHSQEKESLDYLVLTQGIATVQGRTETSEGIDQKLSLHYFSRVGFIVKLLPLLEQSPDARVLSVLSAGVHSTYKNYKVDPELRENYSLKNAADAAGFYNDIALDSLSREHPNVTFIHSAPGFVNTNWGTEMPAPLRAIIRVLQSCCGRSKADCAEFM